MKQRIGLLICVALLICFYSGTSQSEVSKVDFQIGVSVPEAIHLGIGVKTGDFSKANFRFGYLPDSYYSFLNTYTISGGFNFYFGKLNEKRKVKRWSYNPGITFLKDETSRYTWNYWLLNNSISYDVFISERFVFQPELGIVFRLSETEKLKPGKSAGWSFGIDPIVLPFAGIRFRYLIY